MYSDASARTRIICMRLHQLLTHLSGAQISGPTDIEITSIAYDSRAVQPGGLFIAINGFHTDGRAFIPQALARGAVAIIVEQSGTGDWGLGTVSYSDPQPPTPNPQPPTIVAVQNTRTALAPIAAAFYDRPG